MRTRPVSDTWERGSPCEQYIGRWSREIAPLLLAWPDPPADRCWLGVGCGTGALSAAMLNRCAPSSLIGVMPLVRAAFRCERDETARFQGVQCAFSRYLWRASLDNASAPYQRPDA